MDILNEKNQVIQTLSSAAQDSPGYRENSPVKESPALTRNAGVNVAVWNLSYQGADLIRGSLIKSGSPDIGPMVLPGVYRIRLNVGGESFTRSVRVGMDPRVHVPDPDLNARLQFALTVRDQIGRLTGLVRRLRDSRRELSAWGLTLQNNPGAASLMNRASQLVARLDTLEAKMHNANATVVYDIHSREGGAKLYAQLAAVSSWTTESDGPVTQGLSEIFAADRRELDQYAGELNHFLGAELTALNADATKLGLTPVAVR